MKNIALDILVYNGTVHVRKVGVGVMEDATVGRGGGLGKKFSILTKRTVFDFRQKKFGWIFYFCFAIVLHARTTTF
jgi:hypothetical protein